MTYILQIDELQHFGVKGMKWGVRKDRKRESNLAYNREVYDSGRRNYVHPQNAKYVKQNASYKINKDGLMHIDAGFVINRVVDREAGDGSKGINFFSFMPTDRANYIVSMAGASHSRIKFLRKLASGYLSQQIAKEPLDSPSTREAYEILKETYQSKRPKEKIPDYDKGGKDWYLEYNAGLGRQKARDEITSDFIDRVQKRGYNMLADDNDGPNGLGIAEAPVIVLDGAKSLRPLQMNDILQKTIDDARKYLDAQGNRKIEEMQEYLDN